MDTPWATFPVEDAPAASTSNPDCSRLCTMVSSTGVVAVGFLTTPCAADCSMLTSLRFTAGDEADGSRLRTCVV